MTQFVVKHRMPLEPLTNLEPANGFEPLTCAFRVRLLAVCHDPWTLLSLKIPIKSRLLRQRGSPKIPDGGERAPRVPQKGRRIPIAPDKKSKSS